MLLLEEPELSLNSAIVRTLPAVLATAQRDRAQLQAVVNTHAPELLDDEGVQPNEVLVLRVTPDGSTADVLADLAEVQGELEAELPISDIVNALIAPHDLAGLIAVGQGKRR